MHRAANRPICLDAPFTAGGLRACLRSSGHVDFGRRRSTGLLSRNPPLEFNMLQESPMYAYIPARDISRARRFYEEKTGLQPGQEVAGGVVYPFAGGTACFLYPTPNAGTSKASQAFWQVADI